MAFRQVRDTLASKIENSSWSTDNDVHRVIQTDDIVHQASTTSGNHDIDAQVLAESLADLGGLERQLSRWDQNKCLSLGALWVDSF